MCCAHLPSHKGLVRIIIIIIIIMRSASQSESKWAYLGSVAWLYAGLVNVDGVKLGTNNGADVDLGGGD